MTPEDEYTMDDLFDDLEHLIELGLVTKAWDEKTNDWVYGITKQGMTVLYNQTHLN